MHSAGCGLAGAALIAAAAMWIASTTVFASPSARFCDQAIDAPVSEQLAACNALIESGEFSGQNLADIYLMRGRIHIFNGRDREHALADFDRALKLSPRYAAVYFYRSWIHKLNGDRDNQIADLSEAIKINPDEAELYSERGMAYVAKGDVDRALTDFTQAMKLDPDNYRARLGYDLYQRGADRRTAAPVPYGGNGNASIILKLLELTRP